MEVTFFWLYLCDRKLESRRLKAETWHEEKQNQTKLNLTRGKAELNEVKPETWNLKLETKNKIMKSQHINNYSFQNGLNGLRMTMSLANGCDRKEDLKYKYKQAQRYKQ